MSLEMENVKRKVKSNKNKDPSSENGAEKQRETDALVNKLMETSINEENWLCSVSMLVEDGVYSTPLLEDFRTYVKAGIRPVIKNIHSTDILAQISAKRGGKAPKMNKKKKPVEGDLPSTAPKVHPILEAASQALRGGKLTTELLALVIKHLILNLKQEDFSRREEKRNLALMKQGTKDKHVQYEMVEKSRESSKEGTPDEKKRKKDNSSISRESSKSESRLSSTSKEIKKGNSKDKKSKNRENSKDRPGSSSKVEKKEDQPVDGPHLYVALSGLYDPLLPQELIRVGVPIKSIIKLQGVPLPVVQSEDERVSTDVEEKSGSRKTKNKNKDTSSADEAEIVSFWSEVKSSVEHYDSTLLLKDVAILAVPPLDLTLQGDTVYNLVCNALYNVHHLSRNHNMYVRNMKVCALPRPCVLFNTDLYNSTVQMIPAESLTVAFILHCVVEQVCFTESQGFCMDGSEIYSKTDEEVRQGSVPELNQIELTVHNMLWRMPSTGLKLEPHIILLYGDIAFQKTYHINNPKLDAVGLTVNMLQHTLLPSLWQYYQKQDDITRLLYNYHIHNLWKHMAADHVSVDLLHTYLHLLIFKKLYCPIRIEETEKEDEKLEELRTYRNTVLRGLIGKVEYSRKLPENKIHIASIMLHTDSLEELPDSDYGKQIRDLQGLQQCPETVGLVNEDNNPSFSSHGYNIVEAFNKPVMLQILDDAYSNFNCIHYLYYAPSDVILLHCHNNFDDHGTLKDNWMVKLCTPVDFRDFCSYVIEEQVEWLELHGNIHEAQLKEEENQKNSEQLMPAKAGDGEILSPPHGLLSGDKLLPLENSEELEPSPPSSNIVYGEALKFLGYDLGPLRKQMSGHTARHYFTDGTKIKVDYCDWLYEKKFLCTQIIQQRHTFILHCVVERSPSIPSFHLVSESGIIIAFEQINKENMEPSFVETEEIKTTAYKSRKNVTEDKNGKKSPPSKERKEAEEVSSAESVPQAEPPITYDMKLSWPSGLFLETVKDVTKTQILYIKQKYLCNDKISDEQYRCLLNTGNILKFRTDGTVHILCSDSTIFICKRFRKTNLYPPNPPPTPASTVYLSADESDVEGGDKKSQKMEMSKEGKNTKGKREGGGKKTEKNKETNEIEKTKSVTIKETLLPSSPPESRYVLPIPPSLALVGMEIVEYDVIMPMGGYYTVVNGMIVREHKHLVVRTATDNHGEIFTRREDGTNRLFRPDGSLVTTFVDGSRITTHFIEEDKEIEAEDNNETEERHCVETFVPVSDDNIFKEVHNMASSVSFPDQKSDLNQQGETEFINDDAISSSGFISVHMNCCVEHPNYATIMYDNSSKYIEILMPHDLQINITSEGAFNINMNETIRININSRIATFETEFNTSSVITLDPKNENGSFTLCNTTDYAGNSFIVDYFGNTTYEPARNMDRCQSVIRFKESQRSREQRYFVLYRDLSGGEFIHVDEYDTYLNKLPENKTVASQPTPDDSLVCSHTILCPVDLNESQKWIMPYQSDYVLPSKLNRCDLRPATGDQPTWLHNPSQISKVGDTPLFVTNAEWKEYISGALTLRVVRHIEQEGRSAADAMEGKLIEFLQSTCNLLYRYMTYQLPEPRPEEQKAKEKELVLRALGTTSVSLSEVYHKYGMKSSLGNVDSMSRSTSPHKQESAVDTSLHKITEQPE